MGNRPLKHHIYLAEVAVQTKYVTQQLDSGVDARDINFSPALAEVRDSHVALVLEGWHALAPAIVRGYEQAGTLQCVCSIALHPTAQDSPS